MNQLDRSLDTLAAAKTIPQIAEALGAETARMGFEWFVYDVLVNPNGWTGQLVCGNYPQAWVDHYIQQRYTRDDIAMIRAMSSVVPIAWGGPATHLHLTERQRIVLEEGAEAGLRSGAIVPVHGPGPGKSVLAVSSSLTGEGFNRLFVHHRHELQVIATYAQEQIIKLDVGKPRASLSLSPREAEILTWTALGEAALQIAGRLNISSHTVHQHIDSARKKLGARNKVQAASIAIAHGLIRI
ncbi:LuxR family transcriptional regulator [Nitrospirillum sp. BR 11828]|uniref:helix-turn-helix transcriptional regulator n=1 Tax=Nitrospirillum sp. BR 11828 TaxID=3104325 RepID=UPI002ACA56F4|nr:LuxR family transcriptional regulator [Nitrospirillum sp. BR 11828]MDZ5648705.1 LuxR family transcriptional regulator [Nitrospirillum sp. BR 11828]